MLWMRPGIPFTWSKSDSICTTFEALPHFVWLTCDRLSRHVFNRLTVISVLPNQSHESSGILLKAKAQSLAISEIKRVTPTNQGHKTLSMNYSVHHGGTCQRWSVEQSWTERYLGQWLGGRENRDLQLCIAFCADNFLNFCDSRSHLETMMKDCDGDSVRLGPKPESVWRTSTCAKVNKVDVKLVAVDEIFTFQ